MLFARLLNAALTRGGLTLVDADGLAHRLGPCAPAITLRLHDKALHWQLLLNPRLRFGEAYMDGRLTIEGGSL